MNWLRVALLTLLLTGCMSAPIGVPGSSIAPGSINTPDCRAESQRYLTSTVDLLGRWQDAFALGSNSSRIALGPVVAEMQAIRREHQALETPTCAAALDYLVQLSMQSSIDGFLAFMADKPDATVQAYFNDAASTLTKAKKLISELQ